MFNTDALVLAGEATCFANLRSAFNLREVRDDPPVRANTTITVVPCRLVRHAQFRANILHMTVQVRKRGGEELEETANGTMGIPPFMAGESADPRAIRSNTSYDASVLVLFYRAGEPEL